MRRYILICLIFISTFYVYSKEYTLKEDTYSVTENGEPVKLYSINDTVEVTKIYFLEKINSYYFAFINENEYLPINSLKNDSIELSESFFASCYQNDKFLFPDYVIDAVTLNNRNNIYENDLENCITLSQNDGEMQDYWYNYQLEPQLISNSILYLGTAYAKNIFFINSIEIISKNEISLIVQPKTNSISILTNTIYSDLIKSKSLIKMKLKKENDYLSIYCEDEKTPRQIYCYVNKEFKEQINLLIQNGFCNNVQIEYPQKANKKQITNENYKKTELIEPELKINAIYEVKEELNYYDDHLKDFRNQIGILSKGTKIKLISIFEREEIDKINSSWVYVIPENVTNEKEGFYCRAYGLKLIDQQNKPFILISLFFIISLFSISLLLIRKKKKK